jgi:hypothetical protein
MEFNDSESFFKWVNGFNIDGCAYGEIFEAWAKMQHFLLNTKVCSCKKKGKSIDSYYSALNSLKAEDYIRLLDDLSVDYIVLRKGEELVVEFRK